MLVTVQQNMLVPWDQPESEFTQNRVLHLFSEKQSKLCHSMLCTELQKTEEQL